MSLIKCSECNKEISDKASVCPHCGNPMNTLIENDNFLSSDAIEQEYIFCPKCFSTQIHSEQTGFSGGKALVGAITVGPLGLLAGTIGSKKVNMTCLKCTNRFKAGEALLSSHKEVKDLVENFENRLIEDGEKLALYYLKNRLNWQDSQTKDFLSFYLKGHESFRLKYEKHKKTEAVKRKKEEQEKKVKELEKNAPTTIKGAIIQNTLVLLLLVIVAFCLLYGVWYLFSLISEEDNIIGTGFYTTFVIISSFLIFCCSLVTMDEIKKLKRKRSV